MQFIRISGGLCGGSEPPAFQRAERERSAKALANEMSANTLLEPARVENSLKKVLPIVSFNFIHQFVTASFASSSA